MNFAVKDLKQLFLYREVFPKTTSRMQTIDLRKQLNPLSKKEYYKLNKKERIKYIKRQSLWKSKKAQLILKGINTNKELSPLIKHDYKPKDISRFETIKNPSFNQDLINKLKPEIIKLKTPLEIERINFKNKYDIKALNEYNLNRYLRNNARIMTNFNRISNIINNAKSLNKNEEKLNNELKVNLNNEIKLRQELQLELQQQLQQKLEVDLNNEWNQNISLNNNLNFKTNLNMKIKKEDEEKVSSYRPLLYTSEGRYVLGNHFKKKKDAIAEGGYATDKTAFNKFTIKKEMTNKMNLKKSKHIFDSRKFTKKGTSYVEKRFNRFDSKAERKGSFNIFPYIFEQKGN